MTSAQARELVRLDIATVTPGARAGTFDIRCGDVCGVVSLGDLQLIIEPKISMPTLLQMLGYGYAGLRRDELGDVAVSTSSIVSALAAVYARVLNEATQEGLVSGYWSVDERLPTLRGRIRIAEQLTRQHGRLVPLEVTYQEYGANTAENRILATALAELIRLVPAGTAVHQRLTKVHGRFLAVDPLVRGSARPAVVPSRLTARYADALPLATMILDGCGWGRSSGSMNAKGFLIRTWRVFEACVARGLAESVTGLSVDSQESRAYVSRRPYRLRPDIVLRRDGAVVGVLDTKFKAANPQPPDLYQLITYASVYGLQDVHLVYAATGARGATYEALSTAAAGITVHTHVVDVSPQAGFSRDSVAGLAERVVTFHVKQTQAKASGPRVGVRS